MIQMMKDINSEKVVLMAHRFILYFFSSLLFSSLLFSSLLVSSRLVSSLLFSSSHLFFLSLLFFSKLFFFFFFFFFLQYGKQSRAVLLILGESVCFSSFSFDFFPPFLLISPSSLNFFLLFQLFSLLIFSSSFISSFFSFINNYFQTSRTRLDR